MRHTWILGITMVVLWAGAGCSSHPGLNQQQLSMKGYELYSWPVGAEWKFALMAGTNRLKTLDEIQSPERTLAGTEALKSALATLPAGEQVFWEGDNWIRQSQASAGGIALPPAAVRQDIAARCQELGISLTIDE